MLSKTSQGLTPPSLRGFSAVPSSASIRFNSGVAFQGVEGTAQSADMLCGFYVIPVQSLMGETKSC